MQLYGSLWPKYLAWAVHKCRQGIGYWSCTVSLCWTTSIVFLLKGKAWAKPWRWNTSDFLCQTNGIGWYASLSSCSFFVISFYLSLIKDKAPSPSLDVTKNPTPTHLPIHYSFSGLTRCHGPFCKWLGGQVCLQSKASAVAPRWHPSNQLKACKWQIGAFPLQSFLCLCLLLLFDFLYLSLAGSLY